ncbi:hypothetical protein AYM40_07295 [Paraburkholderia phytofirmans OLGA172]|uniref:HTH lysR-type domain-containing protein n=1 Tax=Paraburkholderia phytofirmans OLGA172 TaxID=1417228 RepID=A0A160FIS0_9BURK|nr:LysR family transcriptional regulator [Paraburkholderia phytofirmans]ANB72189.1 hypothetical protein AYM40_07295 [Paraburkholderia phytofirmans OLGA172]
MVKAMWTFVAIVEQQNFTNAGRRLQVSSACTSRALGELEKRLGVQLVHRTTRSVTVTDNGQRYYRFCLQFLAEMREVEASLVSDDRSTTGVVRVHIDKAVGMDSMLRHMSEFSLSSPGLTLELALNGSYRDSFRSGFDCAIVAGELEPSDFRAGRMVDLERVVVGAPRYLDGARAIYKPADITSMRTVELSSALVNGCINWSFERDRRRETVSSRCCMSVDDPEALLQAARYGAGVARLSRQAVCYDIEAGTLLELLPSYRIPSTPVWVLYRYERFQPTRVSIFIEWLRKQLEEERGVSRSPATSDRLRPRGRPSIAARCVQDAI